MTTNPTTCFADDCDRPVKARGMCGPHYRQWLRRHQVPRPERGPCDQCGQVHPRCTGHNNAGQPCGNLPVVGLTVCRNHGGGTKAAVAAGERRADDERALRDMHATKDDRHADERTST